jgi:hypothetical protein
VAVWATDSFHGTPAGTVHRNADDSHGRSDSPACGARGVFYYFARRTLDDVPPGWRCPASGTDDGDAGAPILTEPVRPPRGIASTRASRVTVSQSVTPLVTDGYKCLYP